MVCRGLVKPLQHRGAELNERQIWQYAHRESSYTHPVIIKIPPPIDIWIIHAREENPPAGIDAIEWLLTTMNIATPADAEQYLRWYALRWCIEDWHRVLKSGCRIGDIAHKSAERLRRAIGINLVIVWRIMLLTLMGREIPELSAELLCAKQRRRLKTVLQDLIYFAARFIRHRTNSNNILSRCINSGDYSMAEVHHSLSPSMDIQIASNFERYLYYLLDCNAEKVVQAMDNFKQNQ